MMNNILKRLIALILAMAMSLSLLSANVWAAELLPQEAEASVEEVETLAEECLSAQSSEEDVSAEEKSNEEKTEDTSAEESFSAQSSEMFGIEESDSDGATEVFSEDGSDSGPEIDSEHDGSLQREADDSNTEQITLDTDSTANEKNNLGKETNKVEVLSDGTVTEGDFVYSITGSNASVQEYKGSASSVSIPSVIEGVAVSGIGDRAFAGCTSLTMVTIPDSVTWIGYDAFSNCVGLQFLNVPTSVISIYDGAFNGCSSLTCIQVSEGNSAFCSKDGVLFNSKKTKLICCPGGKQGKYNVPSGVSTIGTKAFYGCCNLTDIIIPDSVTSIESYAFSQCSNLNSVIIPSSVSAIDSYAFYGCSNLTNIEIKSGVKTIGYMAFYMCSSLISINIPDSVISIGEEAFAWCSSMTNAKISNRVTEIQRQTFYECESLEEITIPNTVTEIEEEAFAYCEKMTRVTLPKSISSIGRNAFRFQTSFVINDVYYAGSEAEWNVISFAPGNDALNSATKHYNSTNPDSTPAYCGENVVWSFDSSTGTLTISGEGAMDDYAAGGVLGVDIKYPWMAYLDQIKSVVVCEGVTTIGANSFFPSSPITSVSLPESLRTIKAHAFSGLSGLTSITLPSGITEIGQSAFDGCGLQSIALPNGFSNIAPATFENCGKLTRIVIPISVERVDTEAFWGCNNLTDVYYSGSRDDWDNIIIRGDNECLTNANIHCLESSVSASGYVYSDHDWFTYVTDLNNAAQFFCDRRNFLHVKFINDNDDSVFGKFEYNFVHFIKLKEGWKEICTGSTSKEDAEKVLYACLYESRDSVSQLATAKTGNKATSLIKTTFQYFLDSRGYDLYEKNNLSELLDTETYKKILTEKGLDQYLDQLAQDLPVEDRKTLNDLVEDYKQSSELKNGLKKLGTGLKVLQFVDDTFDYYIKYCQIKESNEIYCEILEYLAQNARVAVYRDAARELLERQRESEQEAMVQYGIEEGIEYIDDKIYDKMIGAVWFLEAAKFGFVSGDFLSNQFFHTSDYVKQKSTMRICAYYGEAISSWVLAQADSSMSSRNDFSKAEKAVVGLEILAKVRLYGEEALKKMCGYKWNKDEEKYVATAIAMMNSHQIYVTALRNVHLEAMRVSCPVDLEIYDKNRNLVVTIKDGVETEGRIGDVSYQCYYSEINGDYVKIAVVPENNGYTYQIKGRDKGKVSCELTRFNSQGELESVYKNVVPVDNETELDVIPSQVIEDSSFITKKENEIIAEEGLTKTADEFVSVSNLTAEQLNYEVPVGGMISLLYQIIPENASNQTVTWESSNENCATVTQNGIVKGIAEGSATITATSEDGEHEVDYSIDVSDDPTSSQSQNSPSDPSGTEQPSNSETELQPAPDDSQTDPADKETEDTHSNGEDSSEDYSSQDKPIEPVQPGIKVGTPKIKSISNTAKGVKLIWTKAQNAKGYHVYCGGKTIATVKRGTSYLFKKNIVNGKKYRFQVTAFNTQSEGAKSKSAGITFLSRPVGVKAKPGKSQMTVRWKRNSKATGYQVDYSLNRSFSKSIKKTISKNKTVKLTVKKLKKNRTYYERVRTWKRVNGKNVFSAWSAVRSVKVK